MSLIRKNRDTFPVFPNFFDDFLSRDHFNWNNSNYSSTSTTIPAVNIRETDDNFEVEMASPGMDKKDFNIRLDGNTLTISSVKEQRELLAQGVQLPVFPENIRVAQGCGR
ncbi:Hsp20/alpha crystallin family protein [Dyadobacter sp.]|uniref:Hsp20/alpha crystallin family protein n=1 Tax=Dyadobacter sp. TaxID=1914288 RepID=UPI003F725799